MPSGTGGVDGVGSWAGKLVRLRFNDAFVPRAGFSLGVSGGAGAAGAASSRARVLVDRRGSDISSAGTDCGHHAMAVAGK